MRLAVSRYVYHRAFGECIYNVISPITVRFVQVVREYVDESLLVFYGILRGSPVPRGSGVPKPQRDIRFADVKFGSPRVIKSRIDKPESLE